MKIKIGKERVEVMDLREQPPLVEEKTMSINDLPADARAVFYKFQASPDGQYLQAHPETSMDEARRLFEAWAERKIRRHKARADKLQHQADGARKLRRLLEVAGAKNFGELAEMQRQGKLAHITDADLV